jgi:hypothetical protein
VAIWWVRSGGLVWVQAFSEQRRGANEASLIALHGSMFAFDCSTSVWTHAANEVSCTCDRPAVHEELRQLANAIVDIHLKRPEHQNIAISGREYPIVTLRAKD